MKAGLGSVLLEEQPPSRQAVRAELEATRIAFHHLLARMTPEDWRRQSLNLAWTNAQLAAHLLFSLRFILPRGIRYARRGKPRAGLPPLLVRTGLADRANKWAARWAARNHTPESLGAAYHEAHTNLLALLEQTPQEKWQRSTYILGRDMTILDLFLVHPAHFQEHALQIRHYPLDLPLS